MTNLAATFSPYMSWRRSPPEFARKMSGRIQSIAVFLCCSLTYSTGVMAHLDFTLSEQIEMHTEHTVVLLGIAALCAAVVPTRSYSRFYVQSAAIILTAILAYYWTLVFNQ